MDGRARSRSIRYGTFARIRFFKLCFLGLLTVLSFAAGRAQATDPAKTVGPNACAECHKQETEA